MKKFLWLAVLACLWPATASATWTTATLLAPEQKMEDGRVQIVIQLSGDKSEQSGKVVLYSSDGDFKDQIRALLEKLNRGLGSTAALPAVGGVFDLAPVPITPPTPTEDDAAVNAFVALVINWQVASVKQTFQLATPAEVASAVAALANPYNSAKNAAVKARMDAAMVALKIRGVI